MDNKARNEELEIDLQRLLARLLKRSWLIGIVALACAVAMFLGTWFFVSPRYQSTAKFYVNNNSMSAIGSSLTSITSADISASRGLVKTYIAILNTRDTLLEVIDYSGADCTPQELQNMISASAVDATEIFQVVVTSTDPQQARVLAEAIAHILPNRIRSIMDGTSAKVVETAVAPGAPSSPSYPRMAMAGFLLGALAMAAVVIFQELLDVTIRTEEDLTRTARYPVLSSIPDMQARAKDGYYGYSGKKPQREKKPGLVGSAMGFAGAEAYKVLRTKLQFSFAQEGGCRVVGISSAMPAEGKSLTSVNLACSLAQLGKRVLLMDCDMRRPTVAEKLQLEKAPGLSDYLTGQIQGDRMFQLYTLEEGRGFHVVTSGKTPPNPIELLSSARMERTVQQLRGKYDYILLDLPPVGEVGDALEAARLADGMVLAVRQNTCHRGALTHAVSQLEFVGARILGTVFNCTTDTAGHYAGYYRR